MLGVGWTEMLVIGVMALIVIGPKELPALMQKLGRFAGTVRRMGSDFQRELNKTTGLDEVRNLRTAITQPLKATTDAIRKEFNNVSSTGAVTPSGAIKPADPKAESVVKEIHDAAGISPPPEPVKVGPFKAAAVSVVTPSTASPPAAVPDLAPPAKPTRPPRKAAGTGVAGGLAPKRAARKKPVESPAPVEAIAPSEDEPKPRRSRAAKKTP
jgi:sec-independent protein translocase protein TatB